MCSIEKSAWRSNKINVIVTQIYTLEVFNIIINCMHVITNCIIELVDSTSRARDGPDMPYM